MAELSSGSGPIADPVVIVGTGSYAPDRVVANGQIAPEMGVDDEWIRRKTGIENRRWAAPGQATSDLATEAARRALSTAGIDAADLATIILATATPDRAQPATACYVQRNIAAHNAFAFDMNSACSGFSFALAVGQSMQRTSGGYVLVIGADVYSRILNPRDRRTRPLFGDAAGAVVLGPADSPGLSLQASALFSYGDLADLITVPAGGSRMPIAADLSDESLRYFTMTGRAVRSFVHDNLPEVIARFLKECAMPGERVDHFIPHQANKVMLDEVFAELELPNARMHQTVRNFGNTGAASVPLTLDRAVRSGAVDRRGVVLLAGFGGGMSVGLNLIHA